MERDRRSTSKGKYEQAGHSVAVELQHQLVFFSDPYRAELLEELRQAGAVILRETHHYLWIKSTLREFAWAQGIWNGVEQIEMNSITDAQKKMKAISPTWRYYGDLNYRRGELIAENLDLYLETEAYHFTRGVVKKPPPAFTLIEPNLILYSRSLSRPSLNGTLPFKENKTTPPSRAYLKLWEALTLLGDWPNKTQAVVDLGSSPGSWTWALAKLGASVLSIDRAPLAPSLSEFKNIEFKIGDAFSLKPEPKDWVFSDVICFPEKLYSAMSAWIASGYCNKFVCSIKFAGAPDWETLNRFKALPHSRVLHLTHNKNEVTWICHPKIRNSFTS